MTEAEVFKDDSAVSEESYLLTLSRSQISSDKSEFLASQVGEYAVATDMLSKLFTCEEAIYFPPSKQAIFTNIAYVDSKTAALEIEAAAGNIMKHEERLIAAHPSQNLLGNFRRNS